MTDKFGRKIDYLRISVTDRCNLRCSYCMPDSIECVPMDEILTDDEIISIVKASADIGISKIKITGGEPLTRKGCISLIKEIKAVPGIESVTLTTNGVMLKEYISELADAGIDGINISLDTMDAEKYRKITGMDNYSAVIEAVKKSAESGIMTKVNAVSLDFDGSVYERIKSGRLPDDIKELISLAKDYHIDVRFIEMMPIGYGKDFPSVPHDMLKEALKNEYLGISKDNSLRGNGPAEYYQIDGFKGRVGLISAIHGKFCDKCNRIRLTSKGEIKTCLCYEDRVDLMPILRGCEHEHKLESLTEVLKEAILNKPMQHCFEEPENITEAKKMVSIGG